MCPWSELFAAAFDAADAERVASLARTGVASGMAGGPGYVIAHAVHTEPGAGIRDLSMAHLKSAPGKHSPRAEGADRDS